MHNDHIGTQQAPLPSSGVILFAHGSRDPQWREPIEAVARTLAASRSDIAVSCAYLELCEPTLPDVVARWAQAGILRIGITPMFLGAGRHAREDLPRMVEQLRRQFPALDLRLSPPIGEDQRMTALMAGIAADSLGAAPA